MKDQNRIMRKRTSGIVACLPLMIGLASSSLAEERGAGKVFSAETIKAQITYLASDALKGRGSGEPGNEKAAQFIVREFVQDGLKPLGTDKQRDTKAALNGSGFFQPFTFIAGRAVGKGNLLAATLAGRTSHYRIGQDYEPSGISGAGKAEGEVVFVGYGIRAPQANRDDYQGLEVKGKSVLLIAGSPDNDPHGPLFEFSDIRRKALTARELGAKAVFVILPKNADTLDHSHSGFDDASDAGIPVLRLRRSVAEAWLGASDSALEKAETEAGTTSFAGKTLAVKLQVVADVKKVEKVSANIIGLIEGSDPVLKNEYLVIGAHLDHLGMGGPGSLAKSSAPAIHHGADDNASGTAGVLQMARAFGRAPLKRSVILMCFSGEELGLLGSDHYVKHPILPLDKTVAMLNMDMIGRLRENKVTVIGSGTAKEWDSLLDEVNPSLGLTLARSESGFGASDQQSFYTKNVPVLFFFTGTHSEYHTPADTADKINAEGEAHVLQLVAACAEHIANNSERPTFQKLKTLDQNAPSRGFSVYFGSIPDYAAAVEGVQLNGVREGSPAEKAGLKAGDIIVKFGDTTVKSVQDYTIVLQNYKPGDVVKIVVQRGTETLTLTATLAARPVR